jgi:RimJ/RimL family protein N-acetyltransferase
MVEFLETERLILRPLNLYDTERLFLLDSNAEVMKYIGVAPLSQIEQSVEVIKMIQKQYAENGIGRYGVIEKASNLLIGWSGLKFLTEEINGIKNMYDLGYRFLPEFWGKGYATEAAKAFIAYGFKDLNLDKICAHAHSGNDASIHTLRKLGFEEKEKFVDELDGAECCWYELKKENFLKQ